MFIVVDRDEWNSLLRDIRFIRKALQQQENEIMGIKEDLGKALDGLEANTTAINGAEDSAEAAFTRLADLIASLKSSATIDPETITRITALSEGLRARAEKLGAAVAAAPQS